MSGIRIRAEKEGAITLEGDLTLPHAAELREILKQAISGPVATSIRFGEVAEADLSCLQLLCSAHRTALRMKKQVRFDGEVPLALRDAADAAGFSRLKGCGQNAETCCLWFQAPEGDSNHER